MPNTTKRVFSSLIFCIMLPWLPVGHAQTADASVWVKMAEEGDPQAQNYVGFLYYTGKQGLKQDVIQAIGWFDKAAQQGNVEAMSNLAALFEKGIGVAQDNKLALAWYEQAAGMGHPPAMRRLRQIYQHGLLDVPANPDKADYWHKQALAQVDAATGRENRPVSPAPASKPVTRAMKAEATPAPTPAAAAAPVATPVQTTPAPSQAAIPDNAPATPAAPADPQDTRSLLLATTEQPAKAPAAPAEASTPLVQASDSEQMTTAVIASDANVSLQASPPYVGRYHFVWLNEHYSRDAALTLIQTLFRLELPPRNSRIELHPGTEGRVQVAIGPFYNADQAELMRQQLAQLTPHSTHVEIRRKRSNAKGQLAHKPYLQVYGSADEVRDWTQRLLRDDPPGRMERMEVFRQPNGTHWLRLGPFDHHDQTHQHMQWARNEHGVGLYLVYLQVWESLQND